MSRHLNCFKRKHISIQYNDNCYMTLIIFTGHPRHVIDKIFIVCSNLVLSHFVTIMSVIRWEKFIPDNNLLNLYCFMSMMSVLSIANISSFIGRIKYQE